MSDMDLDRHLRCKIADLTEECQTLRTQLEHWKVFAIHAEGVHAAWRSTAVELDAELRTLRAAAVDGRIYTQADLIEAVKTERYACSIAVWMTLQDALAPDADDKGLDGWMREAEQRVKGRFDGVPVIGDKAADPCPPPPATSC